MNAPKSGPAHQRCDVSGRGARQRWRSRSISHGTWIRCPGSAGLRGFQWIWLAVGRAV